ncbi:hypothetical protein SGLAM104S_10176 [Streptomyces glaucescens]
MTQTVAVPARTGSSPATTDRPRRMLRAVAVVSCLPYLSLKAAWIAGAGSGSRTAACCWSTAPPSPWPTASPS